MVYRDNAIVDRGDFDRERAELRSQVPAMRTYAAYVMKYMPWVIEHLDVAAHEPSGRVLTSLSSFLTATKTYNRAELARRQLPVLTERRDQTADSLDLAGYHQQYSGWLVEAQYMALH